MERRILERKAQGKLVRARLRGRVDAAALAAFGLPLLLYWMTLAPTVYNLDSAELTTAAATGGILRATGYPLYLTLGQLWRLLPVGDVGYRFNLLSAFLGALTILQVELILRRLDVSGWARLGAWGLLATAPYFWGMSLIAEVYTLHTALMAGIILALLRWEKRPTAGRLGWLTFMLALSLGNHAATVLLLPASAWFVLARRRRLGQREWLAAVAGGVLGASVFLYLPLRFAAGPAFNYAGQFDAAGRFQAVNLQTWAGLIWLTTGRSFAGQMFGYGLGEATGQLSAYGVQLWQAFVGLGVGPGLLGLVVILRKQKRLGAALLLMFLANLIFYVNYRVIDKNTMYLPTYLVWSIWLGVGYHTLLSWLQGGAGQRQLVWLGRGLMIAALGVALVWNWSRVDLSHDWSTRRQSEEIMAAVAPEAVVFGWWDTIPGLQYLQLVEGKRPDVLLVNRFLIGSAEMEALISGVAADRPVYIDNPPLKLVQTMRVTYAAPLYRLAPPAEINQTLEGAK